MTKYEIECTHCKGTGLYIGVCENNGTAVICVYCKGSGHVTHTVPEEFKERKIRKGVKRVFKTSCGYVHGPNECTLQNGKLVEFRNAGCTYEEFLEGRRPKPVKALYCPYLWTNQDMQNKKHKAYSLYLAKCEDQMHRWGTISSCKYFDKAEKLCWPEFEKLAKDWDE